MSRRQQRKLALQALYQADLARISGEEAIAKTQSVLGVENEDLSFAWGLVRGVRAHLAQIDRVISQVSRDWRLERIAGVDRNIIRMALYELFYCPDIPANVAVNEAIELAKLFGTEDSGRFVNGILGKVVEQPDNYRPGDAG